jgi:hypothetical protein
MVGLSLQRPSKVIYASIILNDILATDSERTSSEAKCIFRSLPANLLAQWPSERFFRFRPFQAHQLSHNFSFIPLLNLYFNHHCSLHSTFGRWQPNLILRVGHSKIPLRARKRHCQFLCAYSKADFIRP